MQKTKDCCAEMLVQMDSAFLAIYLRWSLLKQLKPNTHSKNYYIHDIRILLCIWSVHLKTYCLLPQHRWMRK
ncbi:hypothetical protein ZEAMMB73_Zm00001d012116 [Zea mays]|uniref:Uncharacterized protein n=1 Tax=Zea mays TaxID=4577 RepID=A0A1D6G6Q2_MAIZE|nr:hypothetical protein ZEAMMB73_Zm00001d012116 [Zea mays]